MNRLIIIGAGGHGKVILDIALKLGYTDVAFLDDNVVGRILDFDVIGKIEDIKRYSNDTTDFIVGIGNNTVRKRIQEEHNVNWVTLTHPSAQIGVGVLIDVGSVVMAGAVINPCAKIGKGCIVNTGASVDHDCNIEEFVHISPGVHISGNVAIGQCTWIGVGAVVSNNVSITHNCVIGAGAVVVKNTIDSGTYVGVPARKLTI